MTPAAVPFSWQDKRVLRKIRESFDDANTAASALAVYHALTEAASDKQSDEFKTTVPWLAHRAGLSPRTVSARLADLKGIGVIAVETPKLKAPSNYKLLPFSKDCPTSSNGCRSIGNSFPTSSNGCATICNGEASPLRRSEESQEDHTHTGSAEIPTLQEVKAYGSLHGVPDTSAEKFFAHHDGNSLWVNQFGRPINWRQKLISWSAQDRVGASQPKQRNPFAPKSSEVLDLCREKWGDDQSWTNWATSFFGYWNDPKRAWKRNGKPIDWKTELSSQVSKWKSSPQN